MDDFRIDRASPCTPDRDERRPAGPNRKKTGRPVSADPGDEVLLDQLAGGDPPAEDDLGVEDYYVQSDRREEPG